MTILALEVFGTSATGFMSVKQRSTILALTLSSTLEG